MKLRENLTSDKVSGLEQVTPLIARPGITIREAIAMMREQRRGSLLVCDGKRLLGIFTERDVLKRILSKGVDLGARVDSFMTPNPVTIHRTDSVGLVLRLMLEGGYRHLPVVDEGGTPVGVLSVKGLIHYLVEHFPAAVYNLPPSPGQVSQNREGA